MYVLHTHTHVYIYIYTQYIYIYIYTIYINIHMQIFTLYIYIHTSKLAVEWWWYTNNLFWWEHLDADGGFASGMLSYRKICGRIESKHTWHHWHNTRHNVLIERVGNTCRNNAIRFNVKNVAGNIPGNPPLIYNESSQLGHPSTSWQNTYSSSWYQPENERRTLINVGLQHDFLCVKTQGIQVRSPTLT